MAGHSTHDPLGALAWLRETASPPRGPFPASEQQPWLQTTTYVTGGSEGLWQIAQRQYRTTSNGQAKRAVRLLRQANPGWRAWERDVVPAHTSVVIPRIDGDVLPVPYCRRETVYRGEGLTQVLARVSQRESVGRVQLSAGALWEWAWELGTLNGFAVDGQDRSDIEPGWTVFVPERMYRLWREGPRPRPPIPDEWDDDLRGETQVLFGGEQVKWLIGALVDAGRTFPTTPWGVRFQFDDRYVRVYGSNRDIARHLRINPAGRRYRIGSASYQRMAAAVARNQGALLRQSGSAGAQVARQTVGAMRSAGRSIVSRGGAWGMGLSVVLDVGEVVISGDTERLSTAEFWVSDVGENVAKTAIATGAGALAAAGTAAAMGAMAGSVIPGLGTAVGFVVGAGVGLLLSYVDLW